MLRFIATVLLLAISAFADASTYLNSTIAGGTNTITPRSSVTLSPAYAENPVDSTYQLGPGYKQSSTQKRRAFTAQKRLLLHILYH